MIGPTIPAHLLAASKSTTSEPEPGPSEPVALEAKVVSAKTLPEDEDEDEDDYVPALPPDMVAARAGVSTQEGPSVKRQIGPSFPPPQTEEDDEDEDVGPMPLPAHLFAEEKDGVQEFVEREERRRKQIEEASKPKAPKREEWMLVPPSSSDLLASIDPTKLTRPRQFARSAAPSRDVDTSLWTETPAERQQRLADEVAGKRRRAVNADPVDEGSEVDARKRRRQDEEIRDGVAEHTRKVRGAALLEQHDTKSKSRKEDKDEPPAIWDHSRDMALSGRLMDDKQRDKFIREAKGLGDRFGSGKSGGFL